MFSLLDPRLWMVALAALLLTNSVTYFKGTHDGKHQEQLETAARVGKANVVAFKDTERFQRNADEASTLAAASALADRNRRDAGTRAVGGLLNALDAAERRSQESVKAAADYRAAVRTVFESCTAEYRSVGEDAAGHARDSLMYQQAWPAPK